MFATTLLIILSAALLSARADTPDNGTLSTLTLIGSVGRKSYFVDSTPRRWDESKSYCAFAGLHIASIATQTESRFLIQEIGEIFLGRFWTAGRDAQELRQFSWEGTRDQPDLEYLKYNGYFHGIQTCLLLHKGFPGTGFSLFADTCASQFGVMCELTF